MHFFLNLIFRERNELIEAVAKLQKTIAELKDREAEAAQKVKTSLDLVDQMTRENAQVDHSRQISFDRIYLLSIYFCSMNPMRSN